MRVVHAETPMRGRQAIELERDEEGNYEAQDDDGILEIETTRTWKTTHPQSDRQTQPHRMAPAASAAARRFRRFS